MNSSSVITDLNRGLSLPVVVAPMFLISGPDLVIAAGKAGLLGAFPAPNARTLEDLSGWLGRIEGELSTAGRSGQWAINMIVHGTYDRFDAEIEMVAEYKPRIVITALGSPKRALNKVHAFGGKVFSDVINAEQARKAVDAGADGLVLVCAGAGGHTGNYSAFAFVEEVRSFWDGPLIAGGAVSNARGVMAMLNLGADCAYMGTRFIGCRESLVSDDYRQMLIRARMQDIITTAAISGVKGNWMRESLERSGFDFSQVDETKKIDFSNIQGDQKAWKNIWGAGQGVGATTSIEDLFCVVDGLKQDWNWLLQTQEALRHWS
ncbi:NAD(P)H-dependent flavin oxidoreductase [Kordiimonas gwangyangensis]|uniref:NAD(P)H-dependent flavin oxidoreductase n=1 Tax=Kordiimonas gwangyangensis TaxID=288022 RepID=UPI000363A300|nr:nitronate monooxygenase [Kordiimonas gwangyangensis]